MDTTSWIARRKATLACIRFRLKKSLDEVAALYDQRRRVRALEEQLLKDLEFHGIVGKGPAMLEVFDFARKMARHYTNVLLVGPTGTGKELVARAIHQISPVSQHKLAVCNCSAMVDTLLESQLFGHMRGSFTGATDTRCSSTKWEKLRCQCRPNCCE
jgi:transcriptional regulator with GAF, ATPase, and Fis domain